jgi:TolB-like protein/tetratricopeptide (TPR) repeat protein
VAALLSEFEYDIFVSYRQNDNRYDGWVTDFVDNLRKELEATIKGNISIYFDENPHDGLLDTHQVDETLAIKLKSLIFIPIISQTYCDPECFAWQQEFLAFKKMISEDELGESVALANGNIASRILPINIHKIDQADQVLLEKELGGPMRAINFIHEAPGINRPLDSKRDDAYRDESKFIYRDQINKVANSVKEILVAIKSSKAETKRVDKKNKTKVTTNKPEATTAHEQEDFSSDLFGKSLLRRNIPQVIFAYSALAIILYRILASMVNYNDWPSWYPNLAMVSLSIGGVLALILAWMYEFSPEGLIRTKTWESRLNPYPGYKRKPFTGIVTLSALTLILILQSFYPNFYPSGLVPEKGYLKSKAIAVIPFKNLNEEGNDKYLSDGLTMDITTQLSKISDLIVIDSESTSPYRGDAFSNQEIGKKLNVSSILRGSYKKEEEKVHITCQLINIENSQILWAEGFDSAWEDLITLQTEMSFLIADAMGVVVTDEEKMSIQKEPTDNITAYDHYQKGRSFYNNYEEALNDSAIVEFKMAIQLDSNYALAWAGLADAYSKMHIRFSRPKVWNDSSLILATKAVHLDPSSAETYKALANACYADKQYTRGFELLQKSVSLNPSYAPAVANLGTGYFLQGELYNALIWLLQASNIAPNNPFTMNNIGWTYRLLGDLDEAEKWLIKSIEIKPWRDAYRELAYTYVQQGRSAMAIKLIPNLLSLEDPNSRIYEEAGLIALFANNLDSAKFYFKKSVDLNKNLENDANTVAPLALAYFKLNTNEHEQAILELDHLDKLYIDLISEGSEDDDLRIYLAGLKSMLGQDDEALLWIKRSINSNWIDIAMVENIPWFEKLRSNPSIEEILRPLEQNLSNMRQKADKLD